MQARPLADEIREHARERMGKSAATNIGASLLTQMLGLGQIGQTVTNYGAQLLTLQFSRDNESEADLVGMELAARAGYDPRAGVSLWQKMTAANKGAPPQWLSTHPSGNNRIKEIQANLPKVVPLFDRADKPPRRFDQPLRFGQAYYETLEPLAFWGRAQPSEAATHAHRH